MIQACDSQDRDISRGQVVANTHVAGHVVDTVWVLSRYAVTEREGSGRRGGKGRKELYDKAHACSQQVNYRQSVIVAMPTGHTHLHMYSWKRPHLCRGSLCTLVFMDT